MEENIANSEKILFELFEHLKKENFKHISVDADWWKNKENRIEAIQKKFYNVLIFDHEFCKLAWGAEFGNDDGLPNWLYHLKRLAMSEDRLWYVDAEFLKKKVVS